MQHLMKLMLSRPYLSRIPDQSLLQSDPGSTYVDLVCATRDEKGAYAMIYLPQNKPVSIDLTKLAGGNKKAWWFDPRTGKAMANQSKLKNGVQAFTPPAGGQDWVLVIDDASRSFTPPGQ